MTKRKQYTIDEKLEYYEKMISRAFVRYTQLQIDKARLEQYNKNKELFKKKLETQRD